MLWTPTKESLWISEQAVEEKVKLDPAITTQRILAFKFLFFIDTYNLWSSFGLVRFDQGSINKYFRGNTWRMTVEIFCIDLKFLGCCELLARAFIHTSCGNKHNGWSSEEDRFRCSSISWRNPCEKTKRRSVITLRIVWAHLLIHSKWGGQS